MKDIITNLELAHQHLSATHEEEFDLDYFRHDRPCGTLFCAAGHLTRHPHFAKIMALAPFQGRSDSWDLQPVNEADKPIKNGHDRGWLDKYFGANAYDNCFCARNSGNLDSQHPRDNGFGMVYSDVSDKALALWRLEQQIAAVKGAQA